MIPPAKPVTESPMARERNKLFFRVIEALNERGLQKTRTLFDCGHLGHALITWKEKLARGMV